MSLIPCFAEDRHTYAPSLLENRVAAQIWTCSFHVVVSSEVNDIWGDSLLPNNHICGCVRRLVGTLEIKLLAQRAARLASIALGLA